MERQLLLEKSWFEVLKEEFDKPYMKDLKAFLINEKKLGINVFPPSNLIFNAFEKTPFDEVKVVIMGQDPYHGKGQAHGLSFSVPDGMKIPPSLRNIYKEIKEDLGIDPPLTGNLEALAKRGVLLLNATLTVRESSPKSHYNKGWEVFKIGRASCRERV